MQGQQRILRPIRPSKRRKTQPMRLFFNALADHGDGKDEQNRETARP
jgi:hypothetical protein